MIGGGLGAAAGDPEGGSLLVAALKELPLLNLDILVEDPSGDVRADAIVALLGIRFGGLLHLKSSNGFALKFCSSLHHSPLLPLGN